jgi:SAM-dependent methyltransferase
MKQLEHEEIKGIVRDRYGDLARSAAAGGEDCCGPSCCAPEADAATTMGLYTAGETEGLPAEALTASAGCGNPTALASLQPGETVIDFGSGGGIDCFLAARAVGEQGRVIGIDMTTDMIDLARSNAAKLGLTNTEFFHADMERTPVDDDTADILISNCVINLAPDKEAVFREAFRVLKPGGRLMVSDMVLVEAIPEDQAADTANWVACLAGAELKSVYLGRIAGAGFADVEVLSETHLESDEDWRANVRSMNIKAAKPAS